MDNQVAIRRVRITVSVFFGVLSLAVLMLWVRSYWWQEAVVRNYKNDVASFGSHRGQLFVTQYRTLPQHEALFRPVWSYQSWPVDSNAVTWHRSAESSAGWIPHWCVVLLIACGGLAALFAPAWRFGLRQFLIVVTLVAVVLGLGVWLAS